MSQRVTQEIAQYVQRHKAKGVSDEHLFEALQKAGWQEHIVRHLVYGDPLVQDTIATQSVPQRQQETDPLAQAFESVIKQPMHASSLPQQQQEQQARQAVSSPSYQQGIQYYTTPNVSAVSSVSAEIQNPTTDGNVAQNQSVNQSLGFAYAQEPQQGNVQSIPFSKPHKPSIKETVSSLFAKIIPQKQDQPSSQDPRITSYETRQKHPLGEFWAFFAWLGVLIIPASLFALPFLAYGVAQPPLASFLPALVLLLVLLLLIAIVSDSARALGCPDDNWRSGALWIIMICLGTAMWYGYGILTMNPAIVELMAHHSETVSGVVVMILSISFLVLYVMVFATSFRKAFDAYIHTLGLASIFGMVLIIGVSGIVSGNAIHTDTPLQRIVSTQEIRALTSTMIREMDGTLAVPYQYVDFFVYRTIHNTPWASFEDYLDNSRQQQDMPVGSLSPTSQQPVSSAELRATVPYTNDQMMQLFLEYLPQKNINHLMNTPAVSQVVSDLEIVQAISDLHRDFVEIPLPQIFKHPLIQPPIEENMVPQWFALSHRFQGEASSIISYTVSTKEKPQTFLASYQKILTKSFPFLTTSTDFDAEGAYMLHSVYRNKTLTVFIVEDPTVPNTLLVVLYVNDVSPS